MPERPVVVVNPLAGRKSGLVTNTAGPDEVSAILAAAGLEHDLWPTEHAGHGEALARRARDEGRSLVITAGGDGTVAEVATGLLGGETALGVMPLGSIMNIARMLGIPRELPAAALTIREGYRTRIDVGLARTSVGEQVFLEAAGVGIDAGLFVYANQLDSGNWGSFKPLVRFLWRWRPRRVWLTIDGQRLQARVIMVTVANGPYLGPAMSLAPDALVNDGELDVHAYTGFGRRDLLRHAWGIVRRRGAGLPGVIKSRAHEVQIEASRPLMVHADSQPLGTTPASFRILPAALEVVVPREPACPPALRRRERVRG